MSPTSLDPPLDNQDPQSTSTIDLQRVNLLKRSFDDLELQLESEHLPCKPRTSQPCKSRRLDFMLLERESDVAYRYFMLGNHSKAATCYEDFLSRQWSASMWDGGHLVMIQSTLNLARCYLALGQVGKAQIALQELWDTKKTTAIKFSHSIFAELAVLYSEASTHPAGRKDDPAMVGVERSLTSLQRRAKILEASGDLKGAIQIVDRHLKTLPIDSYNLDEDLKDLLVELHLNLAEGYAILGQHAEALLALKRVWNPTGKLNVTWSHRSFKKLSTLYCELKKC
ncbi:hypothetical protein PGT21_036814 [Puccinia graminis f. sp. tritici]|uniref:Uncharacterized protein n=1 Tax=Puccinia graminis f. sp. tritici TaxID=56615 RepID=A0A5B0R8N5_PUCGR|nr:hypothetical protein PGT21_036814 [Puccinia graminis f. sp. tritici]KAA1121513.1 hypothetical protein PGTUg99_030266 [Puccinia graminis f. sp. tritici]